MAVTASHSSGCSFADGIALASGASAFDLGDFGAFAEPSVFIGRYGILSVANALGLRSAECFSGLTHTSSVDLGHYERDAAVYATKEVRHSA
jgi:hypothetical protein